MYFYNTPLFRYRLHDNNSIGVEYLTQSTSEHVQKSKFHRIAYAELFKCVNCSRRCKKTMNPAFYETRENEFKELKQFLIKHNQNLENKSFFGLLKTKHTTIL